MVSPPRSQQARRSLALALALIFVSLLPTPTFLQYFCVAMPFLIVSVVCGVSEKIQGLGSISLKRRAVAFYAVLLPAAITLSFRRQQYRQLTHGIPGTALGDWKWDAAARVSGVIDELAAKGNPCWHLGRDTFLDRRQRHILARKIILAWGARHCSGPQTEENIAASRVQRFGLLSIITA